MNAPTDTVEPPYMPKISSPHGNHDYLYVVGFFITVLFLLAITYAFYMCKRHRSPPPYTIYLGSTTYNDHHHLPRSRGLDDDVIVTFPTFLYSDATKPRTGDVTATDDANGSGCSICLADYKPADVIRLLPECGHLFHVKCIDTWLKASPTCPVCRNSPLSETVVVPVNGVD